MLRIVVLLIAVFTLFSQMDVNAQQYHIDVQRYNNPYLNSSTYDINVRRQPQIGANILDIRRMFLFSQPTQTRSLLEAEREASASRRADAEAELLRAQAELLRYQLQMAKQAQRQQNQNVERAKAKPVPKKRKQSRKRKYESTDAVWWNQLRQYQPRQYRSRTRTKQVDTKYLWNAEPIAPRVSSRIQTTKRQVTRLNPNEGIWRKIEMKKGGQD